MGNVIMKAQQIAYGASNIEKALDDLSVPELIELNKRMDAIDAWKANVHEETYTGSELTIENALALPARSLITEINAIQNLHGYDKPWVGGAGKNKLLTTLANLKANNTRGSWNGNVYSFNNGTITVDTDNDGNVIDIKVNGTFNARTVFYIISPTNNFDLPNGAYYITKGSAGKLGVVNEGYNGDVWVKSLGNSSPSVDEVSITVDHDGYDRIASYINIVENTSFSNDLYYPMIRLSTETDASFAPYTNICPISGRSSVVLTRSDGDEISEDFTIQLGQTVYGADINWDTGAMTVLDAIADMGDLTWSYNSTSQVFNSSALPGATTENVYTDAISSSYKEHQTGMSAMVNGDFRVLDGVMTVKDTAYTDATAFKTSVTGQTVCYELATPLELTLAPTEVQMLKGYNRVTIDNGSIELKALVLGGDN